MSREDLHFRLRVPEDLKVQVETAATQNGRSMTAEIVARLRASFRKEALNLELEREKQDLAETLDRLVDSVRPERLALEGTTDGLTSRLDLERQIGELADRLTRLELAMENSLDAIGDRLDQMQAERMESKKPSRPPAR